MWIWNHMHIHYFLTDICTGHLCWDIIALPHFFLLSRCLLLSAGILFKNLGGHMAFVIRYATCGCTQLPLRGLQLCLHDTRFTVENISRCTRRRRKRPRRGMCALITWCHPPISHGDSRHKHATGSGILCLLLCPNCIVRKIYSEYWASG